MSNIKKPPKTFEFGQRNIDKPKDFKKALITLIKYCKPYIVLIFISIVLSIFSAIFTIIGPSKISDLITIITNGLINKIDMIKVKNVVIFLSSIYLLSAIFGYTTSYIMAIVANKLTRNMRKEISSKINKVPLKYFDNTSYGDILSRVTNDVNTITHTLTDSIGTLVNSIVLFVGVTIMMFVTNSIMAITGIISTLFGFIFMVIILSKSEKYFAMQQEELGNINGHIEEIYSGISVVKVYNAVNKSNKEFDNINEKLYTSSKRSQFLTSLMPPMMHFIGNLGYVSICIVGATLAIKGNITIATIVSFMIYCRLFTNPLSTIAQSFSGLQSTAAASERVFELLDEEELEKEINKKELNPKKVQGNIEFNHVKFGYDVDKTIIHDFNAVIKAGSKIAIVGPTGAGKTTMVNLLMRFYEINNGSITIDGVNTKEITRNNVHDLFCMVLQDTWIFEGTIKDNIVYNNSKIKDKEVIKACKEVGLDHFIKTLQDGYDTLLLDGDSLSLGERQLLTIARAMLSNAPFLILDEATSSVDTRTEEIVQKAMDKLTEGKTSFIIAHRLSTIKNADLIFVMKDGNIIEIGNHNELMNNNGFYKELYNSQFQN